MVAVMSEPTLTPTEAQEWLRDLEAEYDHGKELQCASVIESLQTRITELEAENELSIVAMTRASTLVETLQATITDLEGEFEESLQYAIQEGGKRQVQMTELESKIDSLELAIKMQAKITKTANRKSRP